MLQITMQEDITPLVKSKLKLPWTRFVKCPIKQVGSKDSSSIIPLEEGLAQGLEHFCLNVSLLIMVKKQRLDFQYTLHLRYNEGYKK